MIADSLNVFGSISLRAKQVNPNKDKNINGAQRFHNKLITYLLVFTADRFDDISDRCQPRVVSARLAYMNCHEMKRDR